MQKEKLYRNSAIVQEAVTYGRQLLQIEDIESLDSLLQDLRQLVDAMAKILMNEKGELISLAVRCCKNINASIDEFHHNIDYRERIFSLEIVNLAWNLDIILHRQYDVLNHPNTWPKNRENMLQKIKNVHKMIGKKHYKYKVTIFLVAYNKLEYTKAAIESIYKYTDFSKGDIELITVNNGSTDGTREYFDSLPNEKKINYRHNVLGVYHSPYIYEGEYRIDFSNDIIATPHWLDNLLTCIQSDKNIASVVPVCGDYSISCQQGIHVEYENSFAGMVEMEAFAKQYNHMDYRLWEERAVLMPFLICWRREISDEGVVDGIYTQGDFLDDDLSTTLRRTGWKQILLRDTYLHHFGGVTMNAARAAVKNNSLVNMRKTYYNKWGEDAWESRAMYPLMDEVLKKAPMNSEDDILWIEPMYGSSFLKLKQNYREKQIELGNTVALVRELQYIQDAKAFFKEVISVEDYVVYLKTHKQKFDIISMGRYFNDIVKYEPIKLIRILYEKLNYGGYLLLPVENRQGINSVLSLIFKDAKFRFGNEDMVYKILNVQKLFHELNTSIYPGQCNMVACQTQGDDEKAKLFLSGFFNGQIKADWEKIKNILLISHIWIMIQKV